VAPVTELPFRVRLGHFVQREIGRLLSIIWIPGIAFAMRFVMRYRIKDVSRLRKRFRKMVRENDTPILVCANHLTMVDSAVVTWALGGPWWLLTNYRWVPWNLPEYSNFAFSKFHEAGVWILKCIPVKRGGKREDISRVLKRLRWFLSRGETALIFAEGGRSRSGRMQLDSIAHGMGRTVNSVRRCRALCVYLRGDKQETFSTIPARGDSFYVDFEVFRPESELSGMRRSRDFAQQIAQRLVAMEEKYFARRK